jgi:hypothetical protein
VRQKELDRAFERAERADKKARKTGDSPTVGKWMEILTDTLKEKQTRDSKAQK